MAVTRAMPPLPRAMPSISTVAIAPAPATATRTTRAGISTPSMNARTAAANASGRSMFGA